MSIVPRGVKNVLRNPLRLTLVVLLLGVSLMFVAAMVSLNNSAQDELEAVHKQVGTAITIDYATNRAGGLTQGGTTNQSGSSSSSSSQNGGSGRFGQGRTGSGGTGGGGFQAPQITPVPNSVVTQVTKISGVASAEETLQETDSDNVLKTSTFQTPNGQSISIPPRVNGFSEGATHFTLNGSTPTTASGRMIQNSDANANVAVISQTLASNNNLKVGSTFKLKNTTMTVIGIYKTTTSQFSDNTIIVPMATLQRLYSVSGVDSITAYATSYDQVATVSSQLQKTLGSKFDVTTDDSLYASTFNAINVAKDSIQLALIVSIITAAVVIVFAVLILVRERTLEIGTLKAIGASHWQVVRQFWSEVLTLSLLSSVLAIILLATLGPVISQKFDIASAAQANQASGSGFGGRGGFGGGGGGRAFGGNFSGFVRGAQTQLSNIHLANASLDLQTLLIILGLGIGLAVITSIIPALYVARIKPAIVLRKGN